MSIKKDWTLDLLMVTFYFEATGRRNGTAWESFIEIPLHNAEELQPKSFKKFPTVPILKSSKSLPARLYWKQSRSFPEP